LLGVLQTFDSVVTVCIWNAAGDSPFATLLPAELAVAVLELLPLIGVLAA